MSTSHEILVHMNILEQILTNILLPLKNADEKEGYRRPKYHLYDVKSRSLYHPTCMEENKWWRILERPDHAEYNDSRFVDKCYWIRAYLTLSKHIFKCFL